MSSSFRADLRQPEVGRGRRRAARGLVVLGTVLAFLSVFAIWTERQALDTDEWVETSSRMWQDPAIHGAVSDYLVDQLDEDEGLEGEIEDVLPGFADELAGGAADGVRGLAAAGAEEALDSSAAQTLWEAANRTAHEQLLAVLEDKSEVVFTGGGDVSLNLRSLLTNVAEQVGVGEELVEDLPSDAGRIEILHSDELQSAQSLVIGLKGLALALTVLTFACFALAIRLTRGSSWATVLFSGIGLAAAALAVFVFRFIAGEIVVDTLVKTDSAIPAGEAAWSIGTSLMTSIATTLIVLGLAFVAAGLLGSNLGVARGARRVLAPTLHRHIAYVYGALAIVLVIYLISGPTQGLRAFVTTLILAAFAAFGVSQLRRQTLEELAAEKARVLHRGPER